MSRAQTLVLALLALHLLLGALCVAIGRGEHKSAALRWWGWGLLLYATGLAVTLTAWAWLARPAALVLGNTLIAFSSLLCASGVLLHTPRRMRPAPAAAAIAATVAVLAAANFTGWHRLLVNLGAPTVVACAFFAYAAFAVGREGPRDARTAARFLAAILLLACATWVMRWVVLAGGAGNADRVDLVVSLFAIAQMVNGVAATLSIVWIDVRLMQAELSRVANTDALTGLPNRRAIRLRFGEETSRASRHGACFALALLDIDDFKQVNDRHGHAVGDEMLTAVAAALARAKRGADVLGRIGGEEFMLLLDQDSPEGAREAGERLREAVARAEVETSRGPVTVTISAGVAMYPRDGTDWDHLFAAADRRLYEAKRAGRNRVEALDHEERGIGWTSSSPAAADSSGRASPGR